MRCQTPLDQTGPVIHPWDQLISCTWSPRFAPTFIPGAGQTDGEILETLWAVLNKVGCTTQTMTLAHRSEVLDAHMLDNNWKKMINMGIFTMFISLLFLTEVQSVISARSGSEPRQGFLRAWKLSRN